MSSTTRQERDALVTWSLQEDHRGSVVASIVLDTGLSSQAVVACLKRLERRGIVHRDSEARTIWHLTSEEERLSQRVGRLKSLDILVRSWREDLGLAEWSEHNITSWRKAWAIARDCEPDKAQWRKTKISETENAVFWLLEIRS